MKKLPFQISAAKIQNMIQLTAQKARDMRWGSISLILTRYGQITQFLPRLDLPDLSDILLSDEDSAVVDHLFKKLGDLDSVTNALQENSTTLSDARALFDAVIKRHPNSKSRLDERAQILEKVNFETVIVKVQRKQESQLKNAEQKAVKILKGLYRRKQQWENARLVFRSARIAEDEDFKKQKAASIF